MSADATTADAPDDLEVGPSNAGAWRASATLREPLVGASTKDMLELLLVTTTTYRDIDPFSDAAILAAAQLATTGAAPPVSELVQLRTAIG